MPLPGLVHLENRVTTHRPLDAADALDAVGDARARCARTGGAAPSTCGSRRASATSSCGSATASTSAVGRAPTAAPRGDAPARAARRRRRWRGGACPTTSAARMPAVSGDVNPIHLHPLERQGDGLPAPRSPTACGPAPAPWRPSGAPRSGPRRSRVWFTKPVFLPSTVELVVDRERAALGRRPALGEGPGHEPPRPHPRGLNRVRSPFGLYEQALRAPFGWLTSGNGGPRSRSRRARR